MHLSIKFENIQLSDYICMLIRFAACGLPLFLAVFFFVEKGHEHSTAHELPTLQCLLCFLCALQSTEQDEHFANASSVVALGPWNIETNHVPVISAFLFYISDYFFVLILVHQVLFGDHLQ